ncbi:hypothetical protein TWF694_006858 [Orbilia ellipsospora]|uniref:Uncharacterized protein n=1 Tax=Orbilia ellipsospora TaxID=2528407 RepID=A0AAV9XLG0_9PEZI
MKHLDMVTLGFRLLLALQMPPSLAMRAYGAGAERVTISRDDFEKYYTKEKQSIKEFAAAVEEIDYLQSKCPSNPEELENGDPRFHIQPLLDKITEARVELNVLAGFPMDESILVESVTSLRSEFDEVDYRSTLANIYGIELLVREELDKVQSFLADIGNLSRLRYPDLDDQNVNIHNLAVEIDDGEYDGEQAVTYTVGARDNMKDRFAELISLLEATVSAYDVEIAMNEVIDRSDLEKWFPPNDSFMDVVGALIRWSECWIQELTAGLDALNKIGLVPEPKAFYMGSWFPGNNGDESRPYRPGILRKLGCKLGKKFRKSFSGILPTWTAKSPLNKKPPPDDDSGFGPPELSDRSE